MASVPFQQWRPQVDPTAWVHPSVELLGEVVVEAGASLWPMVVLRGDCGKITIGARSNVQDGSIAHATGGVSVTTIGADCTIGHRVTLHGCVVGDGCLVGMGSILLDNVRLGDGCFVAAGSLLTPGKTFPARSFIMGSPAKRVREVTAEEIAAIAHARDVYLGLAKHYSEGPASSR